MDVHVQGGLAQADGGDRRIARSAHIDLVVGDDRVACAMSMAVRGADFAPTQVMSKMLPAIVVLAEG